MVEQLVQDVGFAEGHGLDHRVVLAALAFHHVGGQGPGGTNETENSSLVTNALAQTTQHLSHEGHRLGGVQRAQGIHLGHAPDRIADLGAFALDDVEIDPHARQGCEDVGEQDHAVGLEGVERLHRDLVGEIRVFGPLSEAGVLVPQVPVDLHVATGLAHHPHRRTLHRFTARSTQEQG